MPPRIGDNIAHRDDIVASLCVLNEFSNQVKGQVHRNVGGRDILITTFSMSFEVGSKLESRLESWVAYRVSRLKSGLQLGPVSKLDSESRASGLVQGRESGIGVKDREMPHVLNVWMYECFSEVDSTLAEWMENVIPRIFNWKVVGIKVKYEKFMGDLSIDASASQPTKRRSTVHFDDKTVDIQDREKTLSTVSRRNMSTNKIPTSVSERVDASKTTPSSSNKSAHQATSDEKWDEIKSFLQSYVAHQAAKNPAKRIMTKSKVFKSSYPTEYASDSKVIEDETTKIKQKFAFDDFIISDDMSRGLIKEYKKWVEEGLLNLHAKKDCGVFVAGYVEYLSEGMNTPSVDFEEEYHRMRYTSLLRNYGL
ncbi:hypothetical protein BC332_23232 [Capsicum chinense]|nr:hypothetical protein BC332_23232 [Capsicum chinense]